MRRFWILLPVLAACAPALPQVTDADRSWARTAFPETQDDLAESRGLYAQKCGGCHMLPLPHLVPQQEWPALMDKMAPRAHADDNQRARMLRYVLTMSRPQATPAQP